MDYDLLLFGLSFGVSLTMELWLCLTKTTGWLLKTIKVFLVLASIAITSMNGTGILCWVLNKSAFAFDQHPDLVTLSTLLSFAIVGSIILFNQYNERVMYASGSSKTK